MLIPRQLGYFKILKRFKICDFFRMISWRHSMISSLWKPSTLACFCAYLDIFEILQNFEKLGNFTLRLMLILLSHMFNNCTDSLIKLVLYKYKISFIITHWQCLCQCLKDVLTISCDIPNTSWNTRAVQA